MCNDVKTGLSHTYTTGVTQTGSIGVTQTGLVDKGCWVSKDIHETYRRILLLVWSNLFVQSFLDFYKCNFL